MQPQQHKKRYEIFYLVLMGVVFYLLAVQCAYGEIGGFKYLENYSAADYGHHPQNWMIVQDSRGIIYVGNQAGVLEYDGVSWRILENIPNKSVRSMAIDNTGTIYIGGKDEVGFLAPDPKGSLNYVSLLSNINKNKRKFSSVWKTLSINDHVYFLTTKYLMRWNTKTRKMKIWESNQYFKDIFYVKKKVFINEKSVGLRQMVKDSLQSLPLGKTFADDKIYMMVPFNSRELFLATYKIGMCLYNYNGGKITPFTTEADDYLKEKQLYHGIRISAGNFALATWEGGLAIIDSRGHLKHIFDKSSGLQDNNVKHVFEDSTGCLWLALNNGISKIEYNSPFSLYDDRNDLEGVVYSIVRHRRDLYVGTSNGLFLLPSAADPFSLNKFRPIAGIKGNCWSLLSIGDSLIAASDSGIFQVDNQRVRKVTDTRGYCLSHSHHEPNRIWAGIDNGIYSLYFKDNRWQPEYLFDQINLNIRTISEDQQGHLWLGTLTRGTARADFTGSNLEPIVKPYNTSRGLPAGEIHVFKPDGQVIFATEQGLFRFNESMQVFVPDYTLGKTFAGGGTSVFRMAADINKHIWFHSRGLNYHAEPRADGSYSITQTPFLRIPIAQVNTIYPEDDIVWFGSVKGLICYDKRVKKNYRHQFRAFIRKVQLSNSKSLVFDGYPIKADEKPLFPVIDYRDRNLRFHYAAPFFENESAVRYSYFLKGCDAGWSDWTDETRKDYTNLDARVYTFYARAKNVYEQLSEEAAFQFKILPPWYQTWWAFLVYAVTALLFIFLVVRWRSWKLVQEKQKLEQIIKERTEKINDQKQQLLEQAEKLKELDKVKSRFFANISHEFRTPLTLIMGPLEQILPACREEKQKKQLKMMLRNSRRLLALINQLLELSKFDSGKVKLQASRQNIIPFLKGMVDSFEITAAENDLELTLQAEEEEIDLYMDPGKLETVMVNLLGNAVKFTPAGGKITVTVKKNPGLGENFPAGWLEIKVCDTGPGIPREQLANIFDRFYQAEAAHEHYQKGTGIGLAIAKEIVELHHGAINVISTKGQGTDFILELPLGDQHLKPDEIIDLTGESVTPPGTGKIPTLDMVKAEKEEEETEEEMEQETTLEKAAKDIILVVEDSVDMRHYIKSSLEPLYQVLEAIDGRDGIEKASQIIPDLIISDIMMPEIDGYELCRVLKNNRDTSHIPIILLTAKAAEENIIEGLETGADDYITKPFNTKILCARIKNLVELRRHFQETLQREMTLKPVQKSISQMDKEFVKDLQEVINKNISDPELNVEELCKRLYMGRTTLYRKILALTGEPPTEFIRSYRLKRGAELLKRGMGSVLEVAFEVGFSSANYFSKCFKKKFHQLPSSFQASEAKKE